MSKLIMPRIIFLTKVSVLRVHLLEIITPEIFVSKVLILSVLISQISVLGEIVFVVQPTNLANLLCEVQSY